jgi:acetyl-CoA synthetase
MAGQDARTYRAFCDRYRVNQPPQFNFARDVVDVAARAEPDRLALVHIDPAGERRDFNFDFFRRRSNALAGGLAAAGVGRGDRVVLMLYRRVEFWISLLALHKLGAVAVPLPAMLTPRDIAYRLRTADVRAAIVDEGLAPRVDEAQENQEGLRVRVSAGPDAARGWLAFDEVGRGAELDEAWQAHRAGGADPAIIFFSSGTTGAPKMVEHDHTYPLGHLVTGVSWHDLRPGDLHLTLADTGWGKALWGKFYGQWMAGAVVFVHDFRGRFDADALLRLMARHRVTTFCAPPTTYRLMIRHDLRKYDLSALRHCTSAGELLNASVFETWKQGTGLDIFEGYGQTETTLQVATFPFMAPKPGSMGRPTPGWPVVLLDDDGRATPEGEIGELCVDLRAGRPLGLFTRYVNDPVLTDKVITGGYYHTGDKAWMDADGYLWFVGRTDDIIKSSGYRIGPFEVESALLTHAAVVEAAVTGMPDELRGQVVKASVVLAPGFAPSETLVHELQNHVKSVTAAYKYPRVIEFVPELPKTISGKIRRAEIRDRDAALRAGHAD